MNAPKNVKAILLFILMVMVDITVIQVFRHLTPVIVWLRLAFIFVVMALSVYAYLAILKPSQPLKTGLIISVISFVVAICESYVVHVIIENGHYKALYLLPSGFALVLPVLMSLVYKNITLKNK